jgi:hypothetical protein
VKPVTRADLRLFDRLAQDLLLQAQDAGCRIKVSRKGHALVYAPDGRSTAVARKMSVANRTAQNAKAGVARLLREKP